MPEWPTNDQLLDAEVRLKAKFDEYYKSPIHDILPELPVEYTLTAVPGMATCLCLDPQIISDDFYRIQESARLIGDTERADIIFNTINASRLSGWKGEAQAAFVARLTAIRSFAESQGEHLLLNLANRSGIYQAAVTSRANYLDLIETTIAAIDVELGNQAKKDAKAWTNLALDLAKDITTLDPKALLAGSIGAIIGVVKNVLEFLPDDSGIEQIIQSFTKNSEKIADQFTTGLDTYRATLNKNYHDLLKELSVSNVSEPMPSSTDVTSPDFRYSAFWSTSREPSEFAPVVEAERVEMNAERAERMTDIRRRLGGMS